MAGIVSTHGVWMDGQVLGKSLMGCIPETVKCKMLILGKGGGGVCVCATSWCDLDLTFL